MGGVRLTAPPGVTFDRNFLGGSLGPGAVFTRASTGTYYDSAGVLRSAAIDAPRFDYDPVTLQLKGLLLEDTSTNMVLNSATLVTQSVTTTATAYTLSFQGTGTVTKSGTATERADRDRSGAACVADIHANRRDANVDRHGVSDERAQVEALPYASSYIPTTTVSVTRARDALSYPVASVTGFDTTQGSLAAEFVYNGQVASGFGSVVDLVGEKANTDHINVYVQQSNASVNNLVKTAVSSVANTGSFPNSVVTGELSKAAVAYTAASLSGAINAVLNPAGGARRGHSPAITNY